MKVDFKINGENVTIEDGEVTCNDKELQAQVTEVISLESQPTQEGYYPSLSSFFEDIEFIGVQGDADLVY